MATGDNDHLELQKTKIFFLCTFHNIMLKSSFPFDFMECILLSSAIKQYFCILNHISVVLPAEIKRKQLLN